MIEKALATLMQDLVRLGEQRRDPVTPTRYEHAELVATEPVGTAIAGHRGAQLVADALKQSVAGGVTEAIVVGLEAVEVEDREHRLTRTANSVLEVGEQSTTIAQSRERVSYGFLAHDLEQRDVRSKREHEAQHDAGERRNRQPYRQRGQGLEVIPGEHSRGDASEQDRKKNRVGDATRRRVPGAVGEGRGGRDQRPADEPELVEMAAVEAAKGVLIDEDAVGNSPDRDPGTGEQATIGQPANQRR